MKAMVYSKYGPPDVFQLKDVPEPAPKPNEVLIKVHASSVTAADWRMRKADPFAARIFNGLFKPTRTTILGFELSGEVESVGRQVTRFKVGDQVFGHNDFRFGGYAEYVCVPEAGIIARKPASASFDEAAAVSFGGLAALNHLRKTNIQSRQEVLVYAASGSAGTFAVQLAKHSGAHVTGVCGPSNVDWVRELGADEVIDYTREDFQSRGAKYNVIFDAIGKLMTGISPAEFRKALVPGGTYVSVEMDRKDRPEDLEYLAALMDAGKLKTVIDRKYPLERLAEAHAYVEKGHKKGNVVIQVCQGERRM